MRNIFLLPTAFIICLTTASIPACAAPLPTTVHLKTVSEGAGAAVIGMRVREITLTPQPPEAVKHLPEKLAGPLYGTLTLGPKEKQTSAAVILDEDEGQPTRIYVDANANGDLTDDPPVTCSTSHYKTFDGKELTLISADANVQVAYGSESAALHLHFLRYDKNDPNRAGYASSLLCTVDSALTGSVTLGGNSYKAMLVDTQSSGDYRGTGNSKSSGVLLLLDINGNGKFDPRGEMYDTAQPFTIKGITYEIAQMSASGTSFVVVKSARTMPEILPPPDLSVGKTAPSFTHKTIDGRTVRFPDDYKGKLVLLYFWASYCPVCGAQIPFVVDAYAAYHERGLEILGVSVDPPERAKDFPAFLRDHKMHWTQICDGKFWQAAIAQLYYITDIPTPLLIDGSTGKILATGTDLVNKRLGETLAAHLPKKK